MIAKQPEDVTKAFSADPTLCIAIPSAAMHNLWPNDDQTHVTEGAFFIRSNDKARMPIGLWRNCPIISGGELNIYVMVEDDRIQDTFFKAKKPANNNFDMRTDKRLFNFLQLIEIATPCAWCIDKRVNTFAKHSRNFRGERR